MNKLLKDIELKELIKTLEISIKNKETLITALTHRSYLNEFKETQTEHNERLEFLGDAVLELIISEFLFSNFANRPEGELTSFRAAVVKTESLAETSRKLGLGDYLRMSKGEESTGGRDKDYLLANTFEAILGAIYIENGYQECKKFVHRWLVPKIEEIVKNRLDIDSKTKFQEVAQNLFKFTPEYKLVKEEGPDHEKIFTMSVYVGDKVFGTGKGASKQKAEENAASKALKSIYKMDKNVRVA